MHTQWVKYLKLKPVKKFYHVSTPAFVCLMLDEQFANTFSQDFTLHGHRNNMEEKTYLAMDLPVYGESDSVNFILVEDKLW